MAVDLTTIFGLKKPDDTEIARLWADDEDPDTTLDAIAKFNDDLIREILSNSRPTTYTPSLTADVTNPNLGSQGTSEGLYTLLPNNFVNGMFKIRADGSGINAGSGTYRISLPFDIDSSFHIITTSGNAVFPILGWMRANDNNDETTARQFVLRDAGLSDRVVPYPERFTGKTVEAHTNSSPFVLQVQDVFFGQFFYKATIP